MSPDKKAILALTADNERLREERQEWRSRMGLKVTDDVVRENARLRGLLARVVPYLDRGMEALHRDIAAALAGEPATEPAKTADQPDDATDEGRK